MMKTAARWKSIHALVMLNALLFFSAALPSTIRAQKPAPAITPGEQSGILQLKSASANPLQLRQFLKKMPKGSDLHYHLSGGVYAETFIKDAVDDGLCVNVRLLTFAKCPDAANPSSATDSATDPATGKDAKLIPAAEAYKDLELYRALIDAFSMRSFVPITGDSAHDHFFDSFGKFHGTNAVHRAEWVDEVASRAAAQNEQYMELMETPDYSFAEKLAVEIGWKDDFKQYREALLARPFQQNVKTVVEHFDTLETKRREIEHCGQADAAPACKVEVRYLFQMLRGFPREIVFAEMLLAFESASADPERIVGVNLVMPEDGYISMRDYDLHMRMVKFFHETYPAIHIALHAGELAYGLVPPDGLCCHVRKAVEAGAERIGHGLSVMYEDRPHELLREMAAKHVMVEINLSSNDVILGVKGKDHPLPLYRQFGVPVSLSTDDEGVSRIDMTNEYVRLVETYGLNYLEVKDMVRTGLEHAFLPGASLWANRDRFRQVSAACAKDRLGSETPSSACSAFLKSSAKASQQWELERRFRDFESAF